MIVPFLDTLNLRGRSTMGNQKQVPLQFGGAQGFGVEALALIQYTLPSFRV